MQVRTQPVRCNRCKEHRFEGVTYWSILGYSTRRTQPSSSSEEPTFYEVIPESSYLQAAPILDQPSVPLVQNQAEGRLLPLNELIKQHIEKVLVRCAGQVEGKRGAARILQINPHTLRAKMRKLGIRWADYRRDDEESLE